MSDELTNSIIDKSQEESLKFDYFVCGVAGAIIAYIIKDYSPNKFGCNSSTMETFSILFLAASFYAGIKRIEHVNDAQRAEAAIFATEDKLTAFSRAVLTQESVNCQTLLRAQLAGHQDTFEKMRKKAGNSYKSRHFWLYLGFCSIFVAKVWQPYEAPATVSSIGAPPASSTMLTQSMRAAIPSTNLPTTATKPERKLMDLSTSTNSHHN